MLSGLNGDDLGKMKSYSIQRVKHDIKKNPKPSVFGYLVHTFPGSHSSFSPSLVTGHVVYKKCNFFYSSYLFSNRN